METSFYTYDDQPEEKKQYGVICQFCGEETVFEKVDSAAPNVVSGHNPILCPKKDETVTCFIPSDFGIVVPNKNRDIVWKFQTGGLMCNKIIMRGTFIPLNNPSVFTDNIDTEKIGSTADERQLISLPGQVARRNYEIQVNTEIDDWESYFSWRKEDSDDILNNIWDLIDEKLPFHYERIDSPKGYQHNEEGYQWVKINDAKEEDIIMNNMRNVEQLVGKNIVLVYPNSD